MINGFINIYKPTGITSMDVIRQIKRPYGKKDIKVGHCGTLDPLAEGVLPLAIGNASRLAEYVVNGEKTYFAEITLGGETATYDAESPILTKKPTSHINVEMIDSVLPEFVGDIYQKPPIYSALKYQGKRLYDLARKNIDVDIPSRKITVSAIELLSYDCPKLELRVTCGKGTYIRSIAHDLGILLGCGAFLQKLIRESCSNFHHLNSIHLSDLTERLLIDPDSLAQHVIPIGTAMKHFPKICVPGVIAKRIKNGMEIDLAHILTKFDRNAIFRTYDSHGSFCAVSTVNPISGKLKPVKVFHE
jgi:tRNA pseudouridine55 synthase